MAPDIKFILTWSHELLPNQVVLILAKIADSLSHILNISLLSIDNIISTALKVLGTLDKTIWSRMVLSTYKNFSWDTRV